MKVIKYFTLLLMGGLLIQMTSCIDEDKEGGRFPDFLEAVNMRIVADPDFSSINADDPGSAKVLLNFYSENVEDVESIELSVDFFDFSEGTTSDKVFLKNVPVANFSGGVLRGFELPLSDFKTALGLQDSDFNGLDQVTIYNKTTMKDGRVYPSTITVNDTTSFVNVTPNILNSSATTSFTTTVTIFVQCPVPADFATGKYRVEQTEGPDDPFFGNPTRWATEEVTIVNTGPINRSFMGTYLTFPNRTFNFIVTCGSLVVPKTGAGLGCDGTLSWVSDGADSYTGDAEFTIHLLDNVDGDCGIPAGEPLTLKLTKL
jgi:hypothetical protein